ncbi:MAG: deoxyribonuclease IV [Oscillospiraceae bacterium]|nr:deoxyribonuclease IV [Oscillospiraceae bacterium]
MLHIGCHLSFSGGYLAMGKEALALGADTFAYFTRNPRGGGAKAVDEADAAALRELLAENSFAPLVVHAPYTYNLCSDKESVRTFAKDSLEEDLHTLELLPGNYLNFHPGSHMKQGAEAGIAMIADALNAIMFDGMHTTVLLETMAGKGSEVGGRFEEIRAIIDRVERQERIGVCLDTCHVYDGGYDIVNDPDAVVKEFDRVIGLQYLKAIHINDSKNPFASHKDRHEKIGLGSIGLSGFARIINHPALRELPFILETPQETNQGYAEEIKLLREMAEE